MPRLLVERLPRMAGRSGLLDAGTRHGIVLGMLAAVHLYLATAGRRRVLCAKLHPDNPARCIFRCGWRVDSR